jgi:hypothetical protein
VRWTCERGRFAICAAGEPGALVYASCGGRGRRELTKLPAGALAVNGDGSWTARIEQEVDVPLVEPPLAAMRAPVTSTVATGALYRITIATCAIVDTAVTFRRRGILAWPASALLTGNGISSSARSTSSPQYLWWGPLEPPVIAALVVIALGAFWVLGAVHMAPMAFAFLIPFTGLVALFAAAGQSFMAIWSELPVSGLDHWLRICTSPELLVFVFFMMSDPATAARTPRGRIAFGVVTALVAAALIYPQSTKYGVKTGVLASLMLACGLAPLIEAFVARARR